MTYIEISNCLMLTPPYFLYGCYSKNFVDILVTVTILMDNHLETFCNDSRKVIRIYYSKSVGSSRKHRVFSIKFSSISRLSRILHRSLNSKKVF